VGASRLGVKTHFGNSEHLFILHLRPRESSAKDNGQSTTESLVMNFTRTTSFTPVLITALTLLLKLNMHYEIPLTKAEILITVFQLQVFTDMFFVTCFFLVNESYYIL